MPLIVPWRAAARVGLVLGFLVLVVGAEAGARGAAGWSAYTDAGAEALDRGRYAEALRMFAAALRLAEAVRPADARLVESLTNLARTYVTLHRYATAEPLLKRAVTLAEGRMGPRHPAVAMMLMDYGALLRQLGREAEAAALEARARSILADPTVRAPATTWAKPGAGPEEFERDKEACLTEARYGGSPYGPLIEPEVYTECLERRGWRTVAVRPARGGAEE